MTGPERASMLTPAGGVPRVMPTLPPHLQPWVLPPGWRWGRGHVRSAVRHYQEVIDALGRSLSLVTVADAAHRPWLAAEARQLAHQSHPAIPTTYHYWADSPDVARGPGYLRRWIAGESVESRTKRIGPDDAPGMLNLLRTVGTLLVYLHDQNIPHGAIGTGSCWITPTGRLWQLGWEWALPESARPPAIAPPESFVPYAPEWVDAWQPTMLTDQWQLAALAFAMMTGERPPNNEAPPPLALVRPDCPAKVAAIIDRALSRDPADRHATVATMLRALERVASVRTSVIGIERVAPTARRAADQEEVRLRWATGDDYEVLARLGAGTFGSVWRVRDLSLEREVAMKVLHPSVADDDAAVARFRREAKLAAQLAHPAIVPIYDWESRDGISWYTMELAEGGSVASLVTRNGAQPAVDIATQVDGILDALDAAHGVGIVHRDLKPENVLIDRNERWRLTDFGIAHGPGSSERHGGTGTPEFAAPEQIMGEPQGSSVDLFALGAIIAFTLTGRPPFGTGDARVIVSKQLKGDMDLDGVPAPMIPFLQRALSPHAETRYGDAAEMRTAWHAALDELHDEAERGQWWWRWLGGN
ncbi:MAG: protein kinase [Gemmatimonadaceae bacterium]|nr:protein kinase [Gemmatimonadaceae bacterium]